MPCLPSDDDDDDDGDGDEALPTIGAHFSKDQIDYVSMRRRW